jgi:hypothetical protein
MLSLLSVLDPIRDTLQTRVDQLSGWVNWATATVGVGVALEAIEPIQDLIAWLKFRKRDSVHIKEIAEFVPVPRNKSKYVGTPHPVWIKWCGRIGIVMVVAGVVGEWICGAQLEDAQKAVHEYDLGKIEALRAENLKLEQLIQPRRLTPEQIHELASLTQFAGRTVDIGSYMNDPEGFVLSSQILDALTKTGIHIVDNRSTLAGSSDVFLGVFVQHGDQSLREKLEAILSENGLTKSAVISRTINGKPPGLRMFMLNFDAPPDSVRIMVGLKPITNLSDVP